MLPALTAVLELAPTDVAHRRCVRGGVVLASALGIANSTRTRDVGSILPHTCNERSLRMTICAFSAPSVPRARRMFLAGS